MAGVESLQKVRINLKFEFISARLLKCNYMEINSPGQIAFNIIVGLLAGPFLIVWGWRVVKSKEGKVYTEGSSKSRNVKGDMAVFYGLIIIIIGLGFLSAPLYYLLRDKF